MKVRTVSSVLLLGALSLVGTVASASTYSFERIVGGDPTHYAAQLSLEVTQVVGGALFTIYNSDTTLGSGETSVGGVYFDFGTTNFFSDINFSASNSTAWNDPTGVYFTDGGNPAGLPNGNVVVPVFTADDWGLEENPDGAADPGEWIGFLGTFSTGNFASLISALDSGNFRVGLANDGGGGNYVNTAPSAVPLPAAAWLFGSALLGFVSLSRRRNA